ncbi:hypothetical protein JMN32_25235 [Fulvivirga sp. 29W222]|uniref:Uncharacterized protein n=1 Tax=Fulvivirga marina TaxID=2494733 RepID=A0A937G0W8_9BACT|nr:hypothetical protein [Fulvivirga marina]MBL6449639.1 hypothetical protein [Fulvivirga marina]
MIKIYDYTKTIKDTYFIKDGSNVALFDMQTLTIQRSKGLRYQLFFLNTSVMELKPGTEQYNRVIKEYEILLSKLPLFCANNLQKYKQNIKKHQVGLNT